VLGICEDFCTKEGDNMIRDDLDGFILEVGIIDAEVSIKPLNFVRDELSGDKTLLKK
jgi:hypothetical protein